MVVTEPNCCKHLLYFIIRLLPTFGFIATIVIPILYSDYWGYWWWWIIIVVTAIFAMVWHRGIMVWIHRCGLDLACFGLDLIADTDRGFLYISLEQPFIVSSCVKIDKPDDLEEFRTFVLSHFMGFRRCRSTIVRIWNNYFWKEEKRADVLESMVKVHLDALDDDEVHAFQA